MTFQFKIQIKNITKPPVWRRVVVPANYNFWEFHIVIQASFGWWNNHMFKFSPKGYASYPQIEPTYDDIESMFEYDEGDKLDADKTLLTDIFISEGQKFTYLYDFGDDWLHTIILEKIGDENILFPTCTQGKGKCPPEDCGGLWGYENLKEIWDDKANPEFKEMAEWLGLEENEIWDPKEFDMQETCKVIVDVFSRKEV